VLYKSTYCSSKTGRWSHIISLLYTFTVIARVKQSVALLHAYQTLSQSNVICLHAQPSAWHWIDRFLFEMISITVWRSSWRSDCDQQLIETSRRHKVTKSIVVTKFLQLLCTKFNKTSSQNRKQLIHLHSCAALLCQRRPKTQSLRKHIHERTPGDCDQSAFQRT